MAKSLLKEDILQIQSLLANEFGSVPASVSLREEALDYLIEVVDSDMLGKVLYPEIHQKAGVYLFNIISDLIFPEANTRTAFGSCLHFLKINGFRLHSSLHHEELTQFILGIKAEKYSLREVQEWLKYMISPL